MADVKPILQAQFLSFLLALPIVTIQFPISAAPPDCDGTPTSVYSEIRPSVVSILAMRLDPFRTTGRFSVVGGSGVVIDSMGHVLTNAHVVHGAAFLSMSTGDHENVPLQLVGSDPLTDLAVVRFKETHIGLEHAVFRVDSDPTIGEEVLAIGSPMGLQSTLTRGIISGLGRNVSPSILGWATPLIQTDAPINPGNSGGPLVDLCGRIVGINALGSSEAENIGFAIPAALAARVSAALIENGHVVRPWHGVYGRLTTYELAALFRPINELGLLVETVEPGSPAESIGLRGGSLPVKLGQTDFLLGGDIITKVNGIRIVDMDSLEEALSSLAVGEEVTLEYFRQGRRFDARVRLPERPQFEADAWWLVLHEE